MFHCVVPLYLSLKKECSPRSLPRGFFNFDLKQKIEKANGEDYD